MGPQADDLDDFLLFKDLVDKPMVNVDPPRVCPLQIPNQLFIGRRILERIFLEDLK